MMILGIDASGPNLAVGAVDTDGSAAHVLAEWYWRRPRSAGTHLVSWVEQMVAELGVPQGVVVGVGPGSYTGVRIAVTAAKVLAWSWAVPIGGVSSLQAWAYAAPRDALVLVTSERRGDGFFAGLYFHSTDGPEVILPDFPVDGDLPEGFPTERAVAVVGPLAADPDWMRDRVGAQAYGLTEALLLGSNVARLGIRRGLNDDARQLSPAYLKQPVLRPQRSLVADDGGISII